MHIWSPSIQAVAAVFAALGLALPALAQEDIAPSIPNDPPVAIAEPALTEPAFPNGACHDGHEGPTLQLTMKDHRKFKGQYRIELYGNDPDMFLEGKGRIYKYFQPVAEDDDTQICVTVPDYGEYGLLVIHDMDGDSKPDFLSDGFGLSTNPKLKLRRPQLEEALFTVSQDETLLEIKLQYVTGRADKKRSGPRRR